MTGLLTGRVSTYAWPTPSRRVRRRGQFAALLAIDLDRFKAVNDMHGHAAGDDVIRAVGARIREQIRLTDSAVRRGGDEFSIAGSPISDAETASRSAERIQARLCEPVEIDSAIVSVGASIGVLVHRPDRAAADAGPIARSDSTGCMYEAKRRRRELRSGRRTASRHGPERP